MRSSPEQGIARLFRIQFAGKHYCPDQLGNDGPRFCVINKSGTRQPRVDQLDLLGSDLIDSNGKRVGLGCLEMTGYARPLRM